MYKRRLLKLEQAIGSTGEAKLCLAYKNKQDDSMVIPMFEYSGTIEGGQKIMDEHPNYIFVIMSRALMGN
jgi:hypothetical protein